MLYFLYALLRRASLLQLILLSQINVQYLNHYKVLLCCTCSKKKQHDITFLTYEIKCLKYLAMICYILLKYRALDSDSDYFFLFFCFVRKYPFYVFYHFARRVCSGKTGNSRGGKLVHGSVHWWCT